MAGTVDEADLDCPILFVPYTASGQNAPVVVCEARHTVSRRAIQQILQTQRASASCPFCQRQLLHSNAGRFQVDERIVAALRAPVQHAGWDAIESLRQPSGTSDRAQAAVPAPRAGPTLIRESQQGTLTRFLPKIDATWHELAVLGAATLDEGATVCVVPLLRYDDSEGVRTSVRVVTAAPPPTLQQWMLSHADGKLPLDAWLDAAIALAQCLRTLHARGILHLCLHPDAICLPETRSGPAQLMDFRRARLTPHPDPPAATTTATPPSLPPAAAAEPHEVLATPSELSAAARARAGGAGVPLTGAADVYAFGVVMLHAWLGHSPFAGLTTQEVLAMQDAGATEEWLGDVVRQAPGMEGPLATLLQDCVRADPLLRPSARSLHSQLRTHQLVLLHPQALDSTAELAEASATLAARPPRHFDSSVPGPGRAALARQSPPPSARMRRSAEGEEEQSESVRLAIDAVKALEDAERAGQSPPVLIASPPPPAADMAQPPQQALQLRPLRDESCCERCCGPQCYCCDNCCCRACSRCVLVGLCIP